MFLTPPSARREGTAMRTREHQRFLEREIKISASSAGHILQLIVHHHQSFDIHNHYFIICGHFLVAIYLIIMIIRALAGAE